MEAYRSLAQILFNELISIEGEIFDAITFIVKDRKEEEEEVSRPPRQTIQVQFVRHRDKEYYRHRESERYNRSILETITVPHDKHASVAYRQQYKQRQRINNPCHCRTNAQSRQLYGTPVRRKVK